MPIELVEVQIPGIRGAPGASTVEAEAAAAAAVAAKTAAETAETNAETAATNAASSASAAATSATNAANSATAAATSETNAGNSATAAAASASAASTAATNASNSATAAETSETNAGNSATAAAGSATAAGNSATAAAGSASAAAASATAASADADRAEDAANSIDTSFLLDKPTYDTDEDGKVNAAEAADSAPWGGITGTPTTLAGYGITDAATAAQGLLADTAVLPGDLGTAAAEDVGFFALAAQGALADTALQPADVGTVAALDVDTDTTMAADSDAKVASQKATKAHVAAAIAALLDSAPGTLDTLNELAAALGDDPNFATTVTTALSNKQPLNALLTTLVGLTLSNDDFLQVKGGTVANRTVAQVITDLIAGNLFDARTLATPTLNNAITVEGYAFNTSTNAAVDLANGIYQVPTLTGNWVPASGWPTATLGQFFRLVIKQDGTGSRTITWPSSVKWPASTAPTITATASKADVIDFSSDGTNWFGVVIGQVYL